MTQRDHTDPLVGTERLLIDGSNLLHALGAARAGRRPPRPSSVGCAPSSRPAVRIEIVFDGPPDHGLGGTRVASGLTVRYSGRISADSLLDRLVADAIGTGGTPEDAHRAADAILVVTRRHRAGARDPPARCRTAGRRLARPTPRPGGPQRPRDRESVERRGRPRTGAARRPKTGRRR